METKQRRDFLFEVKELKDTGEFTGFASVYGVLDQGGDVVEAGAFTKSLQDRGNEVPVLWQHDSSEPIGIGRLEDSENALVIHGKLELELPEAKKAYTRLKKRLVKGLSIGFKTVKDTVENGVRHLTELKLYEVSLVTFPMNEKALVTAVKALAEKESKVDFDAALAARELQAMRYQMMSALDDALYSCLWDSALDTDGKIEASETCIEQFHERYMEFLPQYLAFLAQPMTMRALQATERKTLESKAGRSVSAATKQKLQKAAGFLGKAIAVHQRGMDMDEPAMGGDDMAAAMGYLKSCQQVLETLLSEAGDDGKSTTSGEGAAQKTDEPDALHSWANIFCEQWKSGAETAHEAKQQ